MLSRLVTPADKKRVLAGIRDGSIGIAWARARSPERARSGDRDLALVIIDEEQRFGGPTRRSSKRFPPATF